MDDDPFVGPFEGGWRLVCPRVRMSAYMFAQSVWYLALSVVFTIAGLLFLTTEPLALFSFVMGLLSLISAVWVLHVYFTRIAHPARVLELRKDAVMLYERGRGKGPVVDIPYTRDVEVDIYLNKLVKWGDPSMLYGWTFRKGTDNIKLHPDDNWDLWRLQGLSPPIVWLVKHHNMRMGADLGRYMAYLEKGGVVDGRS
jgi:hypothetical protein